MIHQAHTFSVFSPSYGTLYGWRCNCDRYGVGFVSREHARNAGDKHLARANQRR